MQPTRFHERTPTGDHAARAVSPTAPIHPSINTADHRDRIHEEKIMRTTRTTLSALTLLALATLLLAPPATAQLTINETGNPCPGCVGIGTSNPGFTLQLEAVAPVFQMVNTGTAGGAWAWKINDPTGTLLLSDDPSFARTPVKFGLGADDQLFRVGVSATDIVNVNGQMAITNHLSVGSSSVNSAAEFRVVGDSYITGSIGVGIVAARPIHVYRNDGTAAILVQEASYSTSARHLADLRANGPAALILKDTSQNSTWTMTNSNSRFYLSKVGTGVNELQIDASGNLTVTGTVYANSGANHLPDFVFDPDYDLMPLDELSSFVRLNRHLPDVPSAEDVAAGGGAVDLIAMQNSLLQKVEELTLYTVQQHETIESQKEVIEELRQRLDRLEGGVD
jgi:hypothetical protein